MNIYKRFYNGLFWDTLYNLSIKLAQDFKMAHIFANNAA